MAKVGAAAAPQHFFKRELAGEEPLSFDTALKLSRLADRFFSLGLWNRLLETHLVFVGGADSSDLRACSVMGAIGEMFSLMVYLGDAGYRFFEKVQNSHSIDAGVFLSEQQAVFVEYVPRGDAKKPDRQLLDATGYHSGRGRLSPIFRAARLGYHPWYPNESEGKILAECLAAMIWLEEGRREPLDPAAWDTGMFPLVCSKKIAAGEEQYELQFVPAPPLADPLPVVPPLDTGKLNRILARKLRRAGILEVDHFYAPGAVGKQHERKACLRAAAAVQAQTGYAYPPQVALPEASTGEMLVNVVFEAIETGGVVPREIHVRDSTCQALLDPLAQALGFDVKVKPVLPVMDHFKSSLMQFMGAPGAIPLG